MGEDRWDPYELMLFWKMVAKANNIQWIVTQNERELNNQHRLSQQYTTKYMTDKYGKVDNSESSFSSSD